MRVVKALVAVMGLLIVIGIALVAYGLTQEKNKTVSGTANQPEVSVPTAGQKDISAGLEPFGTINIDLVSGEELKSFTIEGAHAYLHIEGPDGGRLVVVSLPDRRMLGQILLVQP
ncbi:MAG: hypothetical protein ABID63_06590 [Pseudomonadota bacterium]